MTSTWAAFLQGQGSAVCRQTAGASLPAVTGPVGARRAAPARLSLGRGCDTMALAAAARVPHQPRSGVPPVRDAFQTLKITMEYNPTSSAYLALGPPP